MRLCSGTRRWIRRVLLRRGWTAALCAAVLFLFVGCEGPQGPDGREFGFIDTRPPEIALLSPRGGVEFFSDTLHFSAEAEDPDGEIESVTFYVNGNDRVDGDSAVLHAPPWEYDWDLARSGTAYGTLTVTAAAADTAGHRTLTPMILVQYSARMGLDTLAYDEHGGVVDGLPLPDRITDLLGNPIIEGHYLNVRFTAPADCELRAVQFRFGDPNLYRPREGGNTLPPLFTRKCPFWALIWWSSPEGYPGEAIDSALADTMSILYGDWTTVALDHLAGDTAGYTFSAGEEFNLGFEPQVSPLDTVSGLILLFTDERGAWSDTMIDRSFDYQVDYQLPEFTGWGSLREHLVGRVTSLISLHIRAVVDYGDGEPSLLTPSPGGLPGGRETIPGGGDADRRIIPAGPGTKQ
ncbi:MAG TPA: hypothetical protein ENI92_06265 [Bacteroidetes bacterium]|nr:hypothetical protein [Bacteroidota bacterium]